MLSRRCRHRPRLGARLVDARRSADILRRRRTKARNANYAFLLFFASQGSLALPRPSMRDTRLSPLPVFQLVLISSNDTQAFSDPVSSTHA